ncbi:MAG: preprotein translocase subunit SecD [Halobacteriaceae archaeon]
MISVRDNWRVAVLVVLLVASGVAILYRPVGASEPGGGQQEGLTNLQYGLQLSGGTQLRAPVVGKTAEGVDVTPDNRGSIEREVAGNISNVTASEVQARVDLDTVEVFARVSEPEVRQALDAAGIAYDRVRDGVTEPTRNVIVDTLEQKINTGGLTGGRAQSIETFGGQHLVVVEVPNANASEVRRLVNRRGVVHVNALFPTQQGNETAYREYVILEQGDYVKPISSPTQVQSGGGSQWAVPVTLTGDAARNFSESMRKFGFVAEAQRTGGMESTCNWQNLGERPDDPGYCLVTRLDGEVVYTAGLGPSLANDIDKGVFVESPGFVVTANNYSQARQLQINLQAGALPAPLDSRNDTVNYISPAFAGSAKANAFLTGIVAVLAVSLVVFLRYGEVRVAAPMVLTALSEVVILLGFAASVGLALDLSHIAGFIAVIGTGVDDLVIIADEVMAEEVSSSRVFRSRFRKALWIIGAAAATTIIAMSPLAILSLGDLRGFAIVTILGVLVGVLLTRPAYGDILRSLLTDR